MATLSLRKLPPPPIVCWALQAPTLLPLLANTRAWDLRYARMADDSGLAETQEMRGVKEMDPFEVKPDVMFVCSPDQLRVAERVRAHHHVAIPVVWVAHNGYELRVVPESWTGPILVMSAANIHAHVMTIARTVFVIRPHVPPGRYNRPRVSVSASPADRMPLHCWTSKNRPKTRTLGERSRLSGIEEACAAAGAKLSIFGDGQPCGFLTEDGKQALYAEGAVYVSSLEQTAGFGLAEHEVLAHGGAIVTRAWGDAFVTWAGHPGLCHTDAQIHARIGSLARQSHAQRHRWLRDCFEASDRILDDSYGRAVMDDGILALLDTLLPERDPARAPLRLRLHRPGLRPRVGSRCEDHRRQGNDLSGLQERDSAPPDQPHELRVQGRRVVQQGRLRGHAAEAEMSKSKRRRYLETYSCRLIDNPDHLAVWMAFWSSPEGQAVAASILSRRPGELSRKRD